MSRPALEICDLRVVLDHDPSTVLVDGISLSVAEGEKVGLVGESGSGKSMTSLSVIGLLPAAARIESGSIRVAGEEVVGLGERQLDRLRGRSMAMVYQDPMSSLNPLQPVGKQIVEAIRVHERTGAAAARRRAVELLGDVGVLDPGRAVDSYPHEFSGGMRQRVMIAMAIACGPALLLADECTTALDVTTQARIVEMLDALVAERRMGVVFVTHDLAVAAGFCDRIAVMRRGVIVEEGSTLELMRNPATAYTRALVESICTFETDPDRPLRVPGDEARTR